MPRPATPVRTPEHAIVMTVLASTDPPATLAFLGEVLGWDVSPRKDADGDDYPSYADSAGRVGAVRGLMEGEPANTCPYIRVDDLDAFRQRVEKSGAATVRPPVEVPGLGWAYKFRVPGGVEITAWTPHPKNPQGF